MKKKVQVKMAQKNKMVMYTRIEYILMLNTSNTIFYTTNFKMSTCSFSFRGGEIVVQENTSHV